MKIKLLNKKNGLKYNNIINFNNNQNYILYNTNFLKYYINDIDNFEKSFGRYMIYFIFFSFLIVFYGISLVIDDKKIKFFSILVILFGLLFVFIFTLLYIFRKFLFVKRRLKKYLIKKISPRDWKILFLTK